MSKDETRSPSIPLTEFIVLKFAELYVSHGRSITTRIIFYEHTTCKKIIVEKNDSSLHYGNRKQLLKIAKLKKIICPIFSHYYRRFCVLTVYKSKPNKKILVLSSEHKSVKIDNKNKHSRNSFILQ